MIKPNFSTKYDHPSEMGEINSGEQIVETAGYIPPEIQIKQLIDAGIRLNEYRKEMYDIPAGMEVDDSLLAVDPTRGPGFDLADGSNILRDFDELAHEEAKKARENKEKARKKEGNPEPDGEVPPKVAE